MWEVENMEQKESWTEVRKNLKALNEDQLIEFLIQRLPQIEGYRVFPIPSRHVPGEHGKDIVASYKDPIGVEFCCYFQTKSKDINTTVWRTEIKPQLEEMLEVPFDLPIARIAELLNVNVSTVARAHIYGTMRI